MEAVIDPVGHINDLLPLLPDAHLHSIPQKAGT